MKKQQNKYYEYVDQFRKISILQKLPTLNDRLQNIFEDDTEKDNNNFMRLRKEPIIDRWDNLDNQQVILANQCVQEKVDNLLEQQNKQYEREDGRVRGHINMFKKWSEVNKDINNKNQSFKFFYKNATPPGKIADQNPEKDDKKAKKKAQQSDFKITGENQKSQFDLLNIGTQKLKYDFKIINEKRMDQFLQKPEKQKNNQAEKQEDLFLQTFRKFQKYKTLEDIAGMDELKIAQNQFTYDLNSPTDQILELDRYFLDKFIYKSVTKSLKSTEKDVQYFRDIGLPSRNLDKYTEIMTTNGKQAIEQDTKEQAHYLHLLRENQLNVNKNDITYDDISNLSNGRVTPLNAYMCIRSEKVTKAQFEKLIKKLDKYKKQEMQKGKQKQQIGITTQDIDLQFNANDKLPLRQQKDSINQLINQIAEIRQSTVLVKPNKMNPQFDIMDGTFNKQKFTRMEILLKKIYEKIVDNPSKYPFTMLEENLDKIDELLSQEYKDGKMLWFVVDCFEEILNNLPNQDNIKSVMKKKPIIGPKVTHYKGNKLLKEETLQTKNLFTYRDKSKSPMQVPTNDRSKVKNKTNNNTSQKSLTPTKTASKMPVYQKESTAKTAKISKIWY